MLLLLLACSTTPEGTDRAPGSGEDGVEDTVVAKLTASTDLCAWEDGVVTDVEPEDVPEGYIDPIWPSPYQPCLDGRLWVGGRILDHPEGRLLEASASATFFTVTVAGEEWWEGEWLDPEEGVDDCGLVMETGNGEVRESSLTWLDAGAVDLLAPSGVYPFDAPPDYSTNWDIYLSEMGIAAGYGGSYGLSVAGSPGGGTAPDGNPWGAFAAIEIPDLLTLPEAMEVTSPSPLGPGVALPREDLALEWTGTSDGTVVITLSTGDPSPWYTLRCVATDDGAFTVPGTLLAGLPAASEASLYVVRRTDTWVGTATGRSIQGTGYVSYEAWDMTVP